jgi:hypothetical protein
MFNCYEIKYITGVLLLRENCKWPLPLLSVDVFTLLPNTGRLL